MSVCAVCTVGELELAVNWMSSARRDSATAHVVYMRHTKTGYDRHGREVYDREPGGMIPAGVHVLVEMEKPGYSPRMAGRFRVLETAEFSQAELQSIGDCPASEWVMIMRLWLSSVGAEHVSCDEY